MNLTNPIDKLALELNESRRVNMSEFLIVLV